MDNFIFSTLSEILFPSLFIVTLLYPLLVIIIILSLYGKGGIEKRRQYPFYEKWLLSLPVLFLSVLIFLCLVPYFFGFISNVLKKPDKDILDYFGSILFWALPIFVLLRLIATPFEVYKTAQFSVKDLRFFIACGGALFIGGLLFFAGKSPHPHGYFFLFYFALIVAVIFVSHLLAIAVHASIEGQKEEEQKQEQAKEAENQTRAAFYSSLSTFLDSYGAALVKYPLSYFEAGSPLQAKIRADIETLSAFLQRIAPEETKTYLDSEIAKGNTREPAAILFGRFSAATLSAHYIDKVPLYDMQALLFALWKDLLNVSAPEDITEKKIVSFEAVPNITAQQFSVLKDTFGERVAETFLKTCFIVSRETAPKTLSISTPQTRHPPLSGLTPSILNQAKTSPKRRAKSPPFFPVLWARSLASI